MWNAMLHSSQDTPADAFEHLRLAVSGGASLPLEVREAFHHRRFECKISEGYGMTETCDRDVLQAGQRRRRRHRRTSSTRWMEVEIRLADGTCPGRGRGEVFVRGPVVMRGYWN